MLEVFSCDVHIFSDDHTRVKLTTVVGGESDFINANFVDVSGICFSS